MKGTKTGGRKAGVPNKATSERAKLLNEKLDGTDPLLFWAGLLKDPEAPIELRLVAARELAPFLHPKLSSTEANINATVNHEDTLDRVAKAKAAGLI